MKKLGAFFKLVRWPNLLITALMMCLVWHCVLGLGSTIGFTLLVISMVFIVAGGYVINDIFDMVIDYINKPDKVIVGKIFTEKQCKVFYWTLTIIGLLCALVSSILTHGSNFIVIFSCMVLLVCILYSYSNNYKKKLVIGNLIVSLSVAFAVFLPWLFQILYMLQHKEMLVENQEWMHVTLNIVLIYTAFAFLMTLIREIVKDIEDIEGDGRTHCRTIPVIWGTKTAQIIVMLLSLLTFFMIIYAKVYMQDLGLKITSHLLNASGVLMLGLVFVGNIFGLLDASLRTSKQFHLQSLALKVSMLIGVLSMIFIK